MQGMTTMEDTVMSSATTKSTATEEFCDCAVDLKETIKDMAKVAPDAAKEQVDQAREVIKQQYQHARDCVHNKVEHGKDAVCKAKAGVEGFIRERPLQSVLIAAGAGVLLGLLLTRRR
jgi:ElaB/YqjD/DUF883 family membrane-anchored ribosome-binding protein